MKELDIRNIDRSTWKKYRFDEIADSISERVEPQETDLDIYVGLEHLDAESLHIKRTGVPSDVMGTKLKVYKGDVIFGKRRAYQRKAAIAHFDGICSAHAMVLRAKDKVIDPVLFPFFLHSDYFMHRAIDISVGGLSPTINWGTLKTQEFILPPKDQQAKLAELLWAADEGIKRLQSLKNSLTNTNSAFVRKYLKEPLTSDSEFIEVELPSTYQTKSIKGKLPKSWNILTLKQILSEVQSGFAEGLRAGDDGIIQLRMNNVTKEGSIDLTDVIRVPNSKDYSRYKIEVNDVLFNNTNSDDLVGKSVIFEHMPYEIVFSNHFTRLRCNSDLVKQRFLYMWLKYHFEIGLFQRRCTKWVGQAAVQTENLLSLKMIVPSIKQQNKMIEKSTIMEKNLDSINISIKHQKSIQKQLINQIFG